MKKIAGYILSLMFICLIAPSAMASDDSSRLTQGNWQMELGAGTIYAPAFLGSRDYQLSAIPDISIKYKDRFFASVQDGIGYNLINNHGWRVGPVACYAFPRNENGENPFMIAGNKTNALQGLGNVNGTIELGGFAEYTLKEWSTKAQIVQGVNGHKGLLADFNLNYSDSFSLFGPPIIYSIGPVLEWANAQYNNTYWGINNVQSANSGLPTYTTGDGIVFYGVSAFALVPITKALAISIFSEYQHLTNNIANSPLISQRGASNQITVGSTLNYTFNL